MYLYMYDECMYMFIYVCIFIYVCVYGIVTNKYLVCLVAYRCRKWYVVDKLDPFVQV